MKTLLFLTFLTQFSDNDGALCMTKQKFFTIENRLHSADTKNNTLSQSFIVVTKPQQQKKRTFRFVG